MEFRSCARGRQWCCIFHFHWWTASIKPRLLFSHAGLVFWGLPFLQFIIDSNTSSCGATQTVYVLNRSSINHILHRKSNTICVCRKSRFKISQWKFGDKKGILLNHYGIKILHLKIKAAVLQIILENHELCKDAKISLHTQKKMI